MKSVRGVSRVSLRALPLLFLGQTAQSQFPLGPEFRVNSYTTGNQDAGRVAFDSLGNFVVVWQSAQDGSNDGIFGQRYASTGTVLGAEFQINTHTTDGQFRPRVASGAAGDFVVVWMDSGEDGAAYGVFGQRYASSGGPLGGEFQVNSYTTSFQSFPSVASDSSGNFVVVWNGFSEDGAGYGVFGQRYAITGTRLGTEFRVNSYTTIDQSFPSVASDFPGNFVVVWSSSLQDGSTFGIFGQRYASTGTRLGTEFQVNTYTSGSQTFPSVGSDAAGNFVVVWASFAQDGSSFGIFGQRYLSSGGRLGPEFEVNSYTTSGQHIPSVASDPGGNFVVVWMSRYQDGSEYGVFGRRYASSGAPLGSEFQVNSSTPGNQNYPAVASDPNGNFVVVWLSAGQDGSLNGVFGQRYCAQPLTAVSISTSGSLGVCKGSTGGTATVADMGGASGLHQWYYRTVPSGAYVPIGGETGPSYLIKADDFSNGAAGAYYLFCLTTPYCGNQMFSSDNTVVITVAADSSAPLVTPPTALATQQTLCQ